MSVCESADNSAFIFAPTTLLPIISQPYSPTIRLKMCSRSPADASMRNEIETWSADYCLFFLRFVVSHTG